MSIFVSAYSDRHRLQFNSGTEGGAKQQFREECDINNIVSRYQQTGVMNFVNQRQGYFGDATGIDFHQAMDVVLQGQQMFDQLPSSIRKRFNNDPEEFLAFVSDDANRDEGIKLGLFEPPEPSGTPQAASATVSGGTGAEAPV